jgi:hypothetical protein
VLEVNRQDFEELKVIIDEKVGYREEQLVQQDDNVESVAESSQIELVDSRE